MANQIIRQIQIEPISTEYFTNTVHKSKDHEKKGKKEITTKSKYLSKHNEQSQYSIWDLGTEKEY